VEPKRRLPLLKSAPEPHAHASGAEPDEPPRPPWQWVGFGALAIFVVWLPLAWLATLAAVRIVAIGASPVVGAIPFAASLAVAATAGGYLVGRWGTEGVGVREASLAGLAAALVATVLAWGSAGVSPAALVTVVLATPPAAFGGWLGLKKRGGV
jgi:hypothetical protein